MSDTIKRWVIVNDEGKEIVFSEADTWRNFLMYIGVSMREEHEAIQRAKKNGYRAVEKTYREVEE